MAENTTVPDIFDLRASTTDLVVADVQSLQPNALMELFVLDMTVIGQGFLYFHPGTNALAGDVVWQGHTYIHLPIEAEGFASGSTGTLPRPKVRLANIDGAFSAMVASYDDLIGCKIIRKRTFAKYLDAANFAGGNVAADPNQHFPDDVWFIDQKIAENRYVIEWELASAFDLTGQMLPARQVNQNSCAWGYRGPECGYAGSSYFNSLDVTQVLSINDVCGKRLTSCELRFGATAVLPFGGFPGAIQFD
ncbi:MAG: phage minor tail protein L [Methylobacter sp.]